MKKSFLVLFAVLFAGSFAFSQQSDEDALADFVSGLESGRETYNATTTTTTVAYTVETETDDDGTINVNVNVNLSTDSTSTGGESTTTSTDTGLTSSERPPRGDGDMGSGSGKAPEPYESEGTTGFYFSGSIVSSYISDYNGASEAFFVGGDINVIKDHAFFYGLSGYGLIPTVNAPGTSELLLMGYGGVNCGFTFDFENTWNWSMYSLFAIGGAAPEFSGDGRTIFVIEPGFDWNFNPVNLAAFSVGVRWRMVYTPSYGEWVDDGSLSGVGVSVSAKVGWLD